MKRILPFLTILLLLPSLVSATEYYVSNSGSNTNNGCCDPAAGYSNCQSCPGTNGPWQTIGEVESHAFQPGDRILFMKGDTWYSTMDIPSSGSPENPITFSSYGTGPKPVIDLASEVTSWNMYSGNIYQADVSFNVQQVFLDGKFMNLAHEPDRSEPGGGLLFADSGESYILRDDALTSYPEDQLVGAGIIIHTREWEWEYSRILDYDEPNNEITFDGWGPSVYSVQVGNPYKLTDKLWMLDTPGEWVYTGGMLYVWLPNNANPYSHEIRASRDDYGFSGNQKHNIDIDGFEIRHAARSGIYNRQGNNFTIRNCEIYDTGSYRFVDIWNYNGYGIYFWESDSGDMSDNNGTVHNNIIRNALRGGIKSTRYWRVETSNNTIEDIGTASWFDLPTQGTGIGGIMYNHHNIVKNTVYIGIAGGWKTEYNYVNNTCMYILDGGGIYYGAPKSYTRWITNNVVENTGTITNNNFAIYLDAGATDVQVINNTVINSNRGSYVHWGNDNVIRGNTFYNSRVPLRVSNNSNNVIGQRVDNNIWEDNIAIIMSSASGYYPVMKTNYRTSGTDFGNFDRNTYSCPDPERVVYEQYRNPNPPDYYIYNTYSLAGWQDARDQDLNSRFVPQAGSADPADDSQIIVNRDFDSQTFSYADYGQGKNWKDLDGNPVSWPVTLDALDSQVLMWDSGACTPACYQDSDCGSDPCREYTCSNPGTCSASCSSTEITACIDNDDCCPPGCTEGDDDDCGGGLVAHWTFDSPDISGDVVLDKSGNGNDATIQGATPATGRVGEALYFDGEDDFAATGTTDILSGAGEVTVSAWIRPSTQSEWAGIVQARDTSGWSLVTELRESGVPRGGVTTTSGMNTLDSQTVLPLGEWTHLIFSYNSITMKIYLNGELDITESHAGILESTPRPIYIGRNPQDGISFNGTIDEVMIWNRALSAQEILDLYDSSFHACDISPKDGCVEEHELVPFIDLWKYDSTTNPMMEVMEAVTLWSSGTGCVS